MNNSPLDVSQAVFDCTCFQYLERVGVVLANSVSATNLNAIVFPHHFDFVHEVLKWLHQRLFRNVMLLHLRSLWQESLHFSMLETLPGDDSRYVSPALPSHSTLKPTSTHVRFATVETNKMRLEILQLQRRFCLYQHRLTMILSLGDEDCWLAFSG